MRSMKSKTMKMKDFLGLISILFPDFSTDWNLNEFPYIYFGDFAIFVEEHSSSINMSDVDSILNKFLAMSFEGGDKDNIIIVGFLEVLQDMHDLYTQLKEYSTGKLEKIIKYYMEKGSWTV